VSRSQHTTVSSDHAASPSRISLNTLPRIALWSALSMVALSGSKILDANAPSVIAALPLVILSAVLVLYCKRLSLVHALIASLALLLISRSVLAPTLLSSTAPLWVSGLILLAFVRNFRDLRLPRHSIVVALLGFLLVAPTVLHTDPGTTAKTIGIGVMWLLVFLGAANVSIDERRRLLIALVAAACLESILAILESLVKLEFVREYITGSASDRLYIVRDNLVLGDWTNRAQGTLGYPIPFAAFLTVVILAALLSGRNQRRGWLVAVMVLLISGVVLSGTRSAAVALAAGLAAWFLSLAISARLEKRAIPGLKVAFFATLMVGAVGVAFLVRSIVIGDFSLLHRSAVVDTAWGLRDLPTLRLLFGSGYNSAPRLFDEGYLETGGLEVIDNALISQVISSGLVGLGLLVLILILAFKHASIPIRSILAALVAFFFFFDLLSWHAMTGILFGALGIALANPKLSPRPHQSPGTFVAGRATRTGIFSPRSRADGRTGGPPARPGRVSGARNGAFPNGWGS